MKRTLRELLRTYCYSIATIWRRSTRTIASMGKENPTVECVTKKLFVHTTNEKAIVESVVGRGCAKALSVGHMATGCTKDTAYVALSICSRVKKCTELYYEGDHCGKSY